MKTFVSIAACAVVALPAAAADVDKAARKAVGAWQLEFTTPENDQRTPIVIVGRQRDELVAWYVAEAEPEEFSEVKLDGEDLQLTFRPAKFQGEIPVTFASRLQESGACAGSIEYETNDGDSGSFDFAGNRIEPSDFDNTTAWSISFVTPDGAPREARVTALTKGNETYGWYSSEDYEIPAKKLTKEGDSVVMSMSVKTEEGETVDVTFRGTIDGDNISGDAEYSIRDESGSFPFSGKRAS